jgi:hypothetical protein
MVEPTNVAAKTGAKATKAGGAVKATKAAAVVEGPQEIRPEEAKITVTEASLTTSELEREMDRLSLEQAIRDFEIANGRVVDLTQRLISANGRVVELQQELDRTQTALVELNSRHQAVLGSQAYRLADKLRTLKNLLRQ